MAVSTTPIDRRPVLPRSTSASPPTTAIVVGTSAAALHLIDDNFVEPGWQDAGSHLVSFVVPLAVIAVVAWRSRRARRAGGRAIWTLTLGCLTLVLGSEALDHVASGGLSGDDLTGLLTAVAGVVLVAAGTRELWRSRRREGPRWHRYGRRTVKALVALVLIAYVAYPIADAYLGSNSTRRTMPVAQLGVEHETVTFETSGGLTLTGWYVPSANRAAVIIYPGMAQAQAHARALIASGYGVLLVAPRGYGASEGEPSAWGWGGEDDVHAAVAYLQGRADVDPARVGALGLSVGGEVVLHAAAGEAGLRAVVSEGAGARSWHEYRHVDGAARWLWAPSTIVRMVATSVFANRMPPPGLHDLVAQIEVPVFFIYAARPIGGEALTEDYFELAGGPKELWQTDSGHLGGLDADPDAYVRRVVGFLDDTLLR